MKKIELMLRVLAIVWVVMGILQLISGNIILATTDLVTGLLIALLTKVVEMKV